VRPRGNGRGSVLQIESFLCLEKARTLFFRPRLSKGGLEGIQSPVQREKGSKVVLNQMTKRTKIRRKARLCGEDSPRNESKTSGHKGDEV